MNARLTKRERLNYAAQALSGWYFAHRSHPLGQVAIAQDKDEYRW